MNFKAGGNFSSLFMKCYTVTSSVLAADDANVLLLLLVILIMLFSLFVFVLLPLLLLLL